MTLWHSPTRLNLEAVDRERFTVLVNEDNGHRLVKPVKRADSVDPSGVAYDGIMTDFREGEDWLRSLEVDADGNVVSVGFPKFFNYGEKPDRDAQAREWAAGGAPAFAREKFDGTLVIATKRDGQAHYRTRGMFDMGVFRDALDEALDGGSLDGVSAMQWEGVSYLFELVGPASRQVVDYGATHRLVFLAAVQHRVGFTDGGLRALSLKTPHKFTIGNRSSLSVSGRGFTLAEFAATVAREGKDVGEGFVVQTVGPDGAQHLVKVKSDWYRMAHATLSGATRPKVWRLLADAGVATRDEAVAALEAVGFDFEAMASVSAWVDGYIERRAGVLAAACKVLRSAPRTDDQKTLALWGKAHAGAFFCAVMYAYSGDVARAEANLLAVVLEGKAGALKGCSLGVAGRTELGVAWAERGLDLDEKVGA